MSSAGTSIAHLRELAKEDLQRSHEIQARIEQIKSDVAKGTLPEEGTLTLMHNDNKHLAHDLNRRIEQIEGRKDLNATDREMLQALIQRLSIADQTTMRVAELRDTNARARGRDLSKPLEGVELPLGYKAAWRKKVKAAHAPAEPSPQPPMQPLMEPVLPPPTPAAATHDQIAQPLPEVPVEPFDPVQIGGSADSAPPTEHLSQGLAGMHLGDQQPEAEEYDDDEFELVYEDDDGNEVTDPDQIAYLESEIQRQEQAHVVNMSDWPLLYRIMEVDPDTQDRDMEKELGL